MDENDKNWNQKKMVQMINSVDSTKPLSKQSMRGLGSEELNLQQKIVQTKVWVIKSRQLMDENDKNWNQKKMVQMINSVDSTKPLSKQSMRGLGSEELNLQQKIVQTKVWVIQLKQQIDGNDQIWTKKIVQMTNSVDNTTKPLSKHAENEK